MNIWKDRNMLSHIRLAQRKKNKTKQNNNGVYSPAEDLKEWISALFAGYKLKWFCPE